jgi:uncharacterized integral membrane protein (TIGR00698 family)
LCYTYVTMEPKEYMPGLGIVLAIAFFSFCLSVLHASFDALVISIIIGMFYGNLTGRRAWYEKGVETAIGLFLPLGIAFYGSQLIVKGMHMSTLFSVFLVFSSLFGLTLLASRFFNIEKKTAILLASGLAVCGATAIAIISPLIDAKREDTSIAIISVVMLGLTGMIFYPMIHDIFSLSTEEFGFLAGTTLPMLGQVKVAAGNVSPECMMHAVEVKLVRVSFLFFLISTAVILSGTKGAKIRVPWFVILFVIFAIVVNVTDILSPVAEYLGFASSFFLSAALAAIGFSVDFEAIMEKGIAPLAAIFSSWGMTILILYLARAVL